MRHVTHSESPDGATQCRAVSDEGLDFIKRHEALRLYVYDDATGRAPVNGVFQGYPTIGYGHLIEPPETVEQYRGGISEAMAEKLLRHDLKIAKRAVVRLINVPISEPQFDALVSFTFNAGAGALQRSTLRRKLNRGDYTAIPFEMNRWVHSKGRKLRGLVKRRKEEGSRFAMGTALLQQESHQPPVQLVDVVPVTKPQQGEQLSWVARFYSMIKMGMQQAQNSRQTVSP